MRMRPAVDRGYSRAAVGRLTERDVGRIKLTAACFGIALPLNFGWEMAQMWAYSSSPQGTAPSVLSCALASAGDAAYAAAIYLIGTWLTQSNFWPVSFNLRRIIAVMLSGVGIAILMERSALIFGLWGYSERMINIPVLNVGLWPLLQLSLFPITVLWLTVKMARRRVER